MSYPSAADLVKLENVLAQFKSAFPYGWNKETDISDFIATRLYDQDHIDYSGRILIRYYLGCLDIEIKDGSICYFESVEKRKAGRKSSPIKPGRFFKRQFNWLTDPEVECLTQSFKVRFLPLEYEIIDSKEAWQFAFAYTHEQIRGKGDIYGSRGDFYIKDMSCSCMKHEPKHWGIDRHPSEAYASGDFRIIYAKEKGTGKIAARVVTSNQSCGYIYSVDKVASDLIIEYLQNEGIDSGSQWEGLRLAKIAKPNKYRTEYVLPYVDDFNCAVDRGEYLEILPSEMDDWQNFRAIELWLNISTTQGYSQLPSRGVCDCCGKPVNVEYCESIWDPEYSSKVACPTCAEDESKLVNTRDRGLAFISDCVAVICDNLRHLVYCTKQSEGNYWEMAIVDDYNNPVPVRTSSTVTVQGKTFYLYSKWIEKGDDGEYADTYGLRYYERTTIHSFKWLKSPEVKGRTPSPYLAFVSETIETLRHNYQVTPNGDFERLPELPGIAW